MTIKHLVFSGGGASGFTICGILKQLFINKYLDCNGSNCHFNLNFNREDFFLDAIASLATWHECQSVGVLLKLKQFNKLKLEIICSTLLFNNHVISPLRKQLYFA